MSVRMEIGFVGAGQMGGALIRGLLRAGFCPPDQLLASDARREHLDELSKELGIAVAESNAEVAEKSPTVLIAVKPQDMHGVLSEMSPCLEQGHLVISVAAGVSLPYLESRLRAGVRVIRVMPNTPCLLRKGCSALSRGGSATLADMERAREIFSAVGAVVEAEEKWMDAITGLNGSGPAYVFLFLEALVEAGVRMGLPRPLARTVAMNTTQGAAEMVLATGEHPAVLKDQVASPGGTTLAGLAELERGGFRSLLLDAVEAATFRSRELGELLK